MGYPNRRYRVVDGKLAKRWDGTNDPEWFVEKADARAAEEARLEAAKSPKRSRYQDELRAWAAKNPQSGRPFVAPPPPGVVPAVDDYESWSGPQLRSLIKARGGKGPKVGVESTKAAMIERLRNINEQRDRFDREFGARLDAEVVTAE